MRNMIRSFSALVVVVLVAMIVKAESPPLTSGKVLILDNQQILEGEIEQVGNRFRIRRAGGETWLPAKPGYTLMADRDAAYRLMQSKIDLNDAKDRLQLSRWCYSNGFKAQAVFEAEAASRLLPNDASVRRYCEDLKRLAMDAPKPPASAAMNHDPAPTSVEWKPELLKTFVTKVQPILMNACANCHAGERSGSFKLVRTSPGTVPSPNAIQANVASFAAQVNREAIGESAVLRKALEAHGGATKAPLRDKQSQAYRHLEEFAQAAFATTNVAVGAKKPQQSTEETVETSFDPFDPDVFNKAAHPPQKK